MNVYCPILSFYEDLSYKDSIGHKNCYVCKIRKSTQIKLLHEFDSHGLLRCDNNDCIISATEQIDDIFDKYPIYKLSLNKTGLKVLNLNDPTIEWSSIKPIDISIDINRECVGSVHMIENKMYITLISTEPIINKHCITCSVELKDFIQFNNDIDLSELPDYIKEYLGIPLELYKLSFID